MTGPFRTAGPEAFDERAAVPTVRQAPGITTVQIKLPRPRGHQAPTLLARHRFKLLRWGRRTGKGIASLVGSTIGHGPTIARAGREEPMRRGWLRGGTIAWIGLDYEQSEKIWRLQLKPRFEGVPGYHISESDYRIIGPPTGPNKEKGEITVYSAENVGTLLGSWLHGVVLDEFGHWYGEGPDAYRKQKDAWRRVLRPTLVDHKGWAMFASTPWPGSYYDELCNRQIAGTLNPDIWYQSHLSSQDNDVLDPGEVAELIAEYNGPDDPLLQTEVFAKLIVGGAGLAFPEFVSELEQRVHVVRPAPIPPHWTIVAALDWGWRTGIITTFALGPEGQVIAIHELKLPELYGAEAGEAYIRALSDRGMRLPALIAYDEQLDYEAGQHHGNTVANDFLEGLVKAVGGDRDNAPRITPARKGPGSRIAGKNLVHKALAWKDQRDDEGRLHPWSQPRFRVFTSCPEMIACMRDLPNDPKHPGDVNTKANDHSYDTLRYLLAVADVPVDEPPRDTPEDMSPGIQRDGALRQRRTQAPWEQQHRRREMIDPHAVGNDESTWSPFGGEITWEDE